MDRLSAKQRRAKKKKEKTCMHIDEKENVFEEDRKKRTSVRVSGDSPERKVVRKKSTRQEKQKAQQKTTNDCDRLRNARADKRNKTKKHEELERKIDRLSNPRGRRRGAEENRLALYVYYNLMKEHEGTVSVTDLCQMTAKLVGMSATGGGTALSLADLIKHFEMYGSVLYTPLPRRITSISNAKKLTSSDIQAIDTYITSVHASTGAVTLKAIQHHLFVERNTNVSVDMIRYCLVHYLDYEYGRRRGTKVTSDPNRIYKIRQYILDLNAALKLEEAGTHVLVYTDESYIHQNLSPEFTWIPLNSDGKTGKGSKGQRICILHAISKDGPLCEIDDSNPYPVESVKFITSGRGEKLIQNDDTSRHTCEELFIGKKTRDYHDCMDAERFMKWVEQKLLPTFECMYPHKQMILILDNAPYHHALPLKPLTSMHKDEIISLLYGLQCKGLEFGDEQERFCVKLSLDLSKRSTRTHWTPQKEELVASSYLWIKENRPDVIQSRLLTCLERNKHTAIFTPPYCPDLQPIEEFWGAGKNYARLVNLEHKRAISKCIEDIRTGWYGNADRGPVNCARLVARSIEAANRRLELDPELSGDVRHEIHVHNSELHQSIDAFGRTI